jgi:hypothetical protein
MARTVTPIRPARPCRAEEGGLLDVANQSVKRPTLDFQLLLDKMNLILRLDSTNLAPAMNTRSRHPIYRESQLSGTAGFCPILDSSAT